MPFRGGYAAFAANRALVTPAEWRGPARPSADPYKDALSHKVELECATTTLQEVCATRGLDWEAVVRQGLAEAEMLRAGGLVPAHGRASGGAGQGGPLNAAAPQEDA